MPRKSQMRASGNSSEAPTVEEMTNNKILLDDLIPVISLIDYPLNLLTQSGSARAKYRFDGFGEVKQIIYQDILLIIEQYREFMLNGYFMILDERVIGRHGLQDIQSKTLSKEKIENILSNKSGAVELFKSSSEEQKRLIVGMMTRTLANNPKAIDMNLVHEISRVSGVSIYQNAEDSRELFSNEDTKKAE